MKTNQSYEPKYTCNNFDQLKCIIDKLQAFNIAYRGQSNICYKLQTRIADKLRNQKEVNRIFPLLMKDFREQLSQNNLLSVLVKDDFLFPVSNFKNEWLTIFQAQHIGIHTVVMDWSIDWKVALFFACKEEDKDGQLWVLDTFGLTHNVDDLSEKSIYTMNPEQISDYFFVRPAFEDNWDKYLPQNRLFYQQGAFLIMPTDYNIAPLEEREDFNSRLQLIKITKECKKEINKLYNTKVPVPKEFKGIQGVFEEENNHYKKYDDNFFYGIISYDLLEVVNTVRDKHNFQKIKN
jgi:hypothetical protein